MIDDSEPLAYYKGYPARVKEMRRVGMLAHFGCLAPFVLIPLLATCLYLYAVSRGAGDFRSIGFWLSFGFAFLYLSSAITGYFEVRHARIVPYFSVRLGDLDTFSRGFALAEQCEILDELAIRHNLTPISRFGFADDAKSEPLRFFDPALGLETIDGLLALANGEPRLSTATVEDLECVAKALRKAAEQGVSFSFIVRLGYDKLISPVEMDARKGSFW